MPQDKSIRFLFRQYKINLISYLEKNRVFNSIFSNPLWKGVLILGTGSILAQIVGILGILIITRLYSPSDFGLLGIFSAVLAVIMTFISFRYEFAIPVPKDSETAAHLLVLCISLVCLSSLVLSILLILFGSYFVTIFNLQTIAPFFWLVIIGCLGTGTYQALNYWAIKKQDYATITYTQINQSISGNLCKIFFGIIGIGSLGLLFGEVISHITGVGTFVKKIRLSDRDSFRSISFSGLIRAAREYRDFPIFSMPATLIFTVSMQFPIFFITLFYGVKEVGWYTLAYQMLTLPASFIGNSIAQVFYGEAAKQMHNNPSVLKALYLNIVKKLTLISIPIIGVIALLAPFIFPIIFGKSWLGAGLYTLPLAIVAISEFITGPTNKLAIYGFNNWLFGFHIFRFTLIFIGFYISYLLNIDILLSLFLYGCIVAFTCIILFYLNILAINKLIINHTKIN
jgi:O-antigen/teichoic acid export membrane protein